jgi:multidrug efflux pump subunit AcrA (membrane-fusion protein)
MFARIKGYVKAVYKDIGDEVTEGQVMAEQSVPEREEELQQKEALVAQARAEVEQARKLLAAAGADVTSAVAKVREVEASRLRVKAELLRAESQFERFKKTKGVLTDEVLDESRLSFEAARAAVAEVEARIGSAEADQISKAARRDKAQADVRVAEARVKVAEAAQRYTAALLGYAKLRAPFKGVVTRRSLDVGHLLEASAAKTGRDPVFVVAQIDPVRVAVEVQENDAVYAKVGTRAIVKVQALGGEEFAGTVSRSRVALDAKAGRTLHAEIDLANPRGRLRPGMYVIATLTLQAER